MCDHIMDPSGDVILTLNNPNAPIAASVLFDEDKSQEARDPVPAPGRPKQPPLSSPDAKKPKKPVTFRLSSRHLIVASPVFKTALSGGVWKEGIASSDGDDSGAFFRIDTEDWDVEALVLVMSIIHGRNRQVPLKIPFKTLVNVALVADYYQVAEALRLASSLWIEPKHNHHAYGREALLWVCVSWVFGHAKVFRDATHNVVVTSIGDIDDAGTLQLPIPSAVIEQINEQRRVSLRMALEALHEFAPARKARWRGKEYRVEERRDKLAVAEPFEGQSCNRVFSVLEEELSDLRSSRWDRPHLRAMEERFRDDANEAMFLAWGLGLKDFISGSSEGL